MSPHSLPHWCLSPSSLQLVISFHAVSRLEIYLHAVFFQLDVYLRAVCLFAVYLHAVCPPDVYLHTICRFADYLLTVCRLDV